MTTDLALQALLAAVWRRNPTSKVMIHSDQGSQFTSREWQLFLSQHNLKASLSSFASKRLPVQHEPTWQLSRVQAGPRSGANDPGDHLQALNAVAESFFQLLKRERIRRQTYATREAARQDVFEYIEMFYKPQRKHTNNGMLSPVDFEIRQQKLNQAGV
jgi:putative transposase